MEKENAQQQVWQRVLARQEEPRGDDLRVLLQGAMELAGCYRYLTTALPGPQKDRARALYEGEQANAACLRGISLLRHSPEETLKLWNPVREPVEKLLEKCYHRTRRAMIEYASRSGEPEFGTVFRSLAQREEQHCVWIAQLLGRKRES